MDGVTLTQLTKIYHPKGDIFHVLKKSDESYKGFGEAYFTTVKYKEIKGWKKHTAMTLNLVVPVGEVEFILYNGKQIERITLSNKKYQRLTIAPGIWVAFRGLNKNLNLILNIANIEHDPEEAINAPINTFPFVTEND